MLVIRREQFVAFADAAIARFEADAVAHLYQTLPEECAARGDAAVRECVRLAILEGRQYGLEAEYDFLRYINLTFVLGSGFDRLPWAAEILTNPKIKPSRKMDMIIEKFRNPSNLAQGASA